jgi:hypothetical protein
VTDLSDKSECIRNRSKVKGRRISFAPLAHSGRALRSNISRRSEGQKIRRSEGQKIRRSEGQKIRRSEDQQVRRSEDQQVRRSAGQQVSRSAGQKVRVVVVLKYPTLVTAHCSLLTAHCSLLTASTSIPRTPTIFRSFALLKNQPFTKTDET